MLANSEALPYDPQPLEALQARFAEALVPVYGVVELIARMKLDPNARPGRQRKHVFDFDDGLRIIVSVERDNRVPALNGQPYLHVSFSTYNKPEWDKKLGVVDELHQRAMLLSRGRLPKPQVEQTERGVVHFFYEGFEVFNKLDQVERQKVESAWLGRGRTM